MAAQGDFDVRLDNLFYLDDEEGGLIQQSYYYDLDEFNNVMNVHNTENNLSVLNVNARSLIKHFNEFSAILSDLPSSPDIITVEETWLSESLEPLVQLKGYSFIAKHKHKCKEGGGIGIYIKNEIEYTERDDLTSPNEFEECFNYMFIEINQKDPLKNILVGVFYRPPGG